MKIFGEKKKDKIAHPFEPRPWLPINYSSMINQTALFASRIDEIYNIYSWLVTRRRGASIARGEGREMEARVKSGAALISTSEIHTLDKTRTDERAEGKRMTMKPRDPYISSFPSPPYFVIPSLCVERVKINRNRVICKYFNPAKLSRLIELLLFRRNKLSYLLDRDYFISSKKDDSQWTS